MSREKRQKAIQNTLHHDLYNAVRENRVQAVVDALHAGADPNMSETINESVLSVATRQNNPAMLDLLWMAGATFLPTEVKKFQDIQTAKEHAQQGSIDYESKDCAHLSDARKWEERPGLRPLLSLARGERKVTQTSLYKNYGITFDVEQHLQNVRKSPYKSAHLSNTPEGGVLAESAVYLDSMSTFGTLITGDKSIKK